MGRFRLIFAIVAFLGLMVGLDGLFLKQWLRSLAGWAVFLLCGWIAIGGVDKYMDRLQDVVLDALFKRAWLLVLISVAFALVSFVGAGWILVAPYEELVAWDRAAGSMLRGLESAGGQWLGRLVFFALFAFAGGAASYTAWTRVR